MWCETTILYIILFYSFFFVFVMHCNVRYTYVVKQKPFKYISLVYACINTLEINDWNVRSMYTFLINEDAKKKLLKLVQLFNNSNNIHQSIAAVIPLIVEFIVGQAFLIRC